MLLSKEVFGHSEFTLLDKRLFHGAAHYADTARMERGRVKLKENTTGRMVSICVEYTIMVTNYHCTNSGRCVTEGKCDDCDRCVSTSPQTRTYCESWWEPDSGSGGSTGTGGSTGGTGGGGSTGGTGGEPPCTGGGIIAMRALPCDGGGGGGGGWEPYEDTPPPHLVIPLYWL